MRLGGSVLHTNRHGHRSRSRLSLLAGALTLTVVASASPAGAQTLDTLIVYTPAAAAKGDIDSVTDVMVATANQAFRKADWLMFVSKLRIAAKLTMLRAATSEPIWTGSLPATTTSWT